MPKLLLINPNTTDSMTQKMGEASQSLLPADCELVAETAAYGPPSIEGYYDEVFSVPPMLEKIQQHNGSVGGVIVGCFDDTGVDAARCISDAPVIGICQAACQYATILASSFTIITTLERSVAALEKKVLEYGYARQCQNIRASDIPVLALEACDEMAMQKLHREFQQAIEIDRSEAIILGCAGMVELQQQLQKHYGVPVIEGVTAATMIMDGLARLPLNTSRASAYARPVDKVMTNFKG